MRRKYLTPEFEVVELSLRQEILALSDPETSTPVGGDDLPRESGLDDFFG